MNYPTSEGKNGLIYHIAEGVRVIPTRTGYWTLDVYQKGERDRRNFEKGEEGMKKAIKAGELYAAKMGLANRKGEQEHRIITISDVAAEWLKANHARWSFGTFERYSSIVRDFVTPMIGGLPVKKVARNDVKDLLVEVLEIRSAKTVELIHAVLSGIFGEAIERGHTEENPCNGLLKKLLPPKHKRNQSVPDAFSKDDLEVLLATAWEHLNPPLALVLETIAFSGMRLGECLAMQRDHLDVPNKQYMVSETVRNGRFGLPKTGKRLIDLPEGLVRKLERHILDLRKVALSEGRDVTYLFPGITQRIVQKALKSVCRFAKLRVRHPHDLRHTYASILLMEHYSPAYVQKQLGHHSITMTVDTYGHWIPGEGKKDLDQTLGGTEKLPLKQMLKRRRSGLQRVK